MQQIRQLGRWIPAEITDASGLFVHGSHQAFSWFVFVVEGVAAEMPVLAIEAVKRAGKGKNREVIVAVFRTFPVGIRRVTTSASARANPVSHAVGGQRIVIPRQFAFGGGNPFHSAMNIFTQPAIAPSPFPYLAAVHTQIARDAFSVPRRLSRQPPFAPNPRMNPKSDFTGFFRPGADAIQAQPEFSGNKRRFFLANTAGSHIN